MRSERANEPTSTVESVAPWSRWPGLRLPDAVDEAQGWRPRFYGLAAFTLTVLVVGLYLSHHLMTLHQRSVQQHQLWMNRLGEYVELSRYASNILIPIRSVFTSHEVEGEQTKMHRAFKQFATHRSELRRDLERHVDPATAAPLLEDLEMINDSVTRIVEEGERLYTVFAQRDFDKANRLLTRVSDLNRDIHDLLAFLRDDVRLIQQRQYDAGQAEISRFQKYEILLTIFVLLVVCWFILRERQQAQRMQGEAAEAARDRESLREAASRMRAVVDGIADGIVTLSPNGCIDSWNKAAEQIFGYPNHQIIGNHFCILLASPDREAFAIAFQNNSEGHPTGLLTERFEVLGQRHDGSSFPLDVYLSEIQLGEEWLLTGILSDRTTCQRVARLQPEM